VKLRGDAARNRERVLTAAADVYAERGQTFTMDEVASRAGVGIGTVYRRFPTKDALLDALARPGFERMFDLARDAASQADAGQALDTFVRAVVEQHARVGVPFRRVWDASVNPELRGQTAALVDQVVERAKQAGRLRPDVDRRDLIVLLWTCCGLVDMTDSPAPDVWRRHLDLLLDGLRPQGHGALATAPVEPEAWDRVIATTPVYRLR
jgi:AcrR family transcriptional regulator